MQSGKVSRRARGERTTDTRRISDAVMFYLEVTEEVSQQKHTTFEVAVLPNGRVQCALGWPAANNQCGLMGL